MSRRRSGAKSKASQSGHPSRTMNDYMAAKKPRPASSGEVVATVDKAAGSCEQSLEKEWVVATIDEQVSKISVRSMHDTFNALPSCDEDQMLEHIIPPPS